jgi:hypothetical protein
MNSTEVLTDAFNVNTSYWKKTQESPLPFFEQFIVACFVLKLFDQMENMADIRIDRKYMNSVISRAQDLCVEKRLPTWTLS